MAAEGETGSEAIDRAIDELLTLQHEAQHAPVDELALDVGTMLDELSCTLNMFNELVAAEPCSCGCTPVGIQAVVIQAAMLAIHIAIYSLALSQRNPGGFHIGQKPASPDFN